MGQMRPAILSACLAVSAFSQSFEVASVKRSAPVKPGVFFGPARGGPGSADPGQITWSYATLKGMLMMAYDVKNYQVSGPDWLNTERYDVVAKVGDGAPKEQVQGMWRNLLAERFGVALHHESKELQVEELVVAKGGSRLKASDQDPVAPPPEGPPKLNNGELAGPGLVTTIFPDPNGPRARTVAKAQPISQLTTMLTNQIHRPVLDKTGLTGKYDFSLEFAPVLNIPPGPPGAPSAATAADPAPDLAAAVQQQLGLRLVPGKATLDVIVIDKAEKFRRRTDSGCSHTNRASAIQ